MQIVSCVIVIVFDFQSPSTIKELMLLMFCHFLFYFSPMLLLCYPERVAIKLPSLWSFLSLSLFLSNLQIFINHLLAGRHRILHTVYVNLMKWPCFLIFLMIPSNLNERFTQVDIVYSVPGYCYFYCLVPVNQNPLTHYRSPLIPLFRDQACTGSEACQISFFFRLDIIYIQ